MVEVGRWIVVRGWLRRMVDSGSGIVEGVKSQIFNVQFSNNDQLEWIVVCSVWMVEKTFMIKAQVFAAHKDIWDLNENC